MTKNEILEIIFNSIEEINQQNDTNIAKETSTKLFGRDCELDSLGLVNLITMIEDSIEEKTGNYIPIADERALSLENSPLKQLNHLLTILWYLLMNNLEDDLPVILITGTSKGIGKYMANYYIQKGYRVVGCSRSDSTIVHNNYAHFLCDLSNENEILDLFKVIRQKYKRLDILINNAAINPAILQVAFLPYETIQKIFKINVFAMILFCRESIKLMSRNKFGRIINLGSMATRHEVPGESLYTATKASVNAFSRVLAKEVSSLGITVNVLAPSAIKTDLANAINQEALNEVLNRNAIKKYGDFSDVVNTIDYLIKKESSAITGQIIYLGGV